MIGRIVAAAGLFALSLQMADLARAENAACLQNWESVLTAGGISELHTLLANNCAVLYERGWIGGEGSLNPPICEIAWNELDQSGAIGAARFLVEENCPVLCRDWDWCAG